MVRDSYTRSRVSGLQVFGVILMITGLALLVGAGIRASGNFQKNLHEKEKYVSENIDDYIDDEGVDSSEERIEKTKDVLPMLFFGSMMIIFSLPLFYVSRSKGDIWLDSSKCRDNDNVGDADEKQPDAYDFIIGESDREFFRQNDLNAAERRARSPLSPRPSVKKPAAVVMTKPIEEYIHVETVKADNTKDNDDNKKFSLFKHSKNTVKDEKAENQADITELAKAVAEKVSEVKPENKAAEKVSETKAENAAKSEKKAVNKVSETKAENAAKPKNKTVKKTADAKAENAVKPEKKAAESKCAEKSASAAKKTVKVKAKSVTNDTVKTEKAKNVAKDTQKTTANAKKTQNSKKKSSGKSNAKKTKKSSKKKK